MRSLLILFFFGILLLSFSTISQETKASVIYSTTDGAEIATSNSSVEVVRKKPGRTTWRWSSLNPETKLFIDSSLPIEFAKPEGASMEIAHKKICN